MGYSPLKAGVRVPAVLVRHRDRGAGIASNLVSRIDPRYLAGVGTLMASARCSVRVLVATARTTPSFPPASSGSYRRTDVTTGLDPAVHRADVLRHGADLRAADPDRRAPPAREDSGIGSGVLNTMQQVGGALGLATLSTVSLHYVNNSVADMGPGRRRPRPQPASTRTCRSRTAAGRSSRPPASRSFTEGATAAFLVGSRDDARRLARGVDLPRRQARGAGHRRPRGRRPVAEPTTHEPRRRARSATA